jgi:serine/threonine-protein kinase
MSSPHFLDKAPATPAPSDVDGPLSLGRLPDDMLQEGVRRLGLAALIYAVTFFLAFFGSSIPEWLGSGERPEHWQGLKLFIACISIGLALIMFALTRIKYFASTILLDIGLIFEVAGSFGIAMASVYGSFPQWSEEILAPIRYMGIPWECVWIVVYPMLAPNTPGKTLLASLAAASMGLLTIMISKVTGATSSQAPLSFFIIYYLFSTYVCAFMAFFVSKIITRFGMRLRKAREIGQYQLVELLGRGGMGEVWRSRHRMLARSAAIKLIRPENLGKDAKAQRSTIQRFVREAQITATLKSVHTIDIYDFGTTATGDFYYVMELLDGMDLAAFTERFGPIPAARVIYFLRQVCHSLGEAHTHDLIHRDVKPANLFVCQLGPDYDFIKVLDFGLVRSHRGNSQEMTRLTQEGLACGTPDFMPPEMALGAGNADSRSDIYALGCVGYWLLTGQPVFPAENAMAAVVHHARTEPIPPSQRTEVEVPADLEEIILACLAKEPAARPQSVSELEMQLAACAGSSEWNGELASEWWHLHLPQSPQSEPAERSWP